ncbi:hypothetical protein CH373_10730 [Leptospira perolatii]|uniref:Peptide ABC transporter substrate-binding protein n=1 Tax=Leptospira perolatii TaxID=2023191 RepID=A0A2M9ZLQ4_9LEPT|nr:ABC transporter substrate binding protein [Leptospira perolatii]PJZ69808.1 hypothetical protein CH360_09505 [Leptospira perolatii]PJZ72977.1 hypothetical protein CH373_10730 [Leptospira perolatii]
MNTSLKKILLPFTIIVGTIITGVVVFSSASIASTISSRKSSSVIEVLLSSDSSIYEQALFGIQTGLDAELKVKYLDILSDQENSLEVYFRNLESSSPPVYITVGLPATQVAAKYLHKTPLVFSMVQNPKNLEIETTNACGIGMDVSMEEFFRTLRDFSPDIKKVYSFYSSPSAEYGASEGSYFDLKYRLSYEKVKLPSFATLESELNRVKGEADAIMILNDPLLTQASFLSISEFAKKNKIILMTEFPALVKLGATFGISPDYSEIGVLTGKMANRILNKETLCRKEGIQIPDQFSFHLNEEFAEKSGIAVPSHLQERAKLSGLFNTGVNLLNAGKLKSAKIIFQNILQKDPKNQSALSYQQITVERQTGTQTKELLSKAKKYYEQKVFTLARAEYQKVLQINPSIQEARDGYQAALLGQSEQERLRGNGLESSNPFEAIRMYLASVRTLPTNTAAHASLQSLRARQSPMIGDYLKSAIDSYNQREYEEAIRQLENILLISPEHKEASEYLRLSVKKQEAIKILREKLAR